jgi:hypothetical protein
MDKNEDEDEDSRIQRIRCTRVACILAVEGSSRMEIRK